MKCSGLIFAGWIMTFLLLISASSGGAQTLQTLYAFVSTNGCNPQAPLTVGPDGNFYGTTPSGGTNGGYGTIFKVTTNGVLTSLFQFSVTNGASPYAGLTLGNDGCFYGTTEYGGSYGKGTIYKITAAGIFTLLFSFDSTNGANPTASLTLGAGGVFYGTTVYGGTGYGVVFKLTTNGTFTKLVSFTSAYQSFANVQNTSALIFGTDGALYGTTAYGGSNGDGTVFRVTTNGVLSTFVSIFNSNDGNSYAPSLVLGRDGNFYGILSFGGGGVGAIYKITPSGNLTTLYSFYPYYPYSNGTLPRANLIIGNDGYLYGTTYGGGTNGGYGTIFKISTGGIFTSLASFAFTNGTSPYAGLVLGNDGNLYGTTYGGGDSGYGAVFEYATNGALTELAPFTGTIGSLPKAGLTIGSDGNLYGTTSSGGTNGTGTFFRVTTNGDFSSLATLNSGSPQIDLTLAPDGSFYSIFNDGTVFNLSTNGQIQKLTSLNYPYVTPFSWLKLGSDGAFYGSSYSGGGSGYLFKIFSSGLVTNILSFGGTNGSNPQGGVCLGKDGSFYGTTSSGGSTYPGSGANGVGTVFKFTTNGVLTTLKTFPPLLTVDYSGHLNYSYDGSTPVGGLCVTADGTLYGTTSSGGSNTNSIFQSGFGEVFKVATNGTVSVVSSFSGSNGIQPQSALVAGNDGNLYGTTMFGGTGNTNSGLGTIFRVKPKGGITALISFNGMNGRSPQTDLAIAADGNLYGTTTYGGFGGNGTVFRVLLPPDIAVPLQNQTNIAGASTSFIVGATSLQPLSYQWQKNGTNLVDGGNVSGTATTNLNIAGISDSDAGVYSVIVSNLNFAVTNYATLTVIDPPGITAQPQDQRVVLGSSASFSVSVSNAPPLRYQWQFNSTNILKATNAVFSIQAVALTNNGNYSVVVTNLAGSVVSSNALLTALVPPSLTLQFAAGYPQLNLNGMLSNNFVVQYSTDLTSTNWITLTSLSNLLTSPYSFLDAAGIVPPARFYRVLMQ